MFKSIEPLHHRAYLFAVLREDIFHALNLVLTHLCNGFGPDLDVLLRVCDLSHLVALLSANLCQSCSCKR